MSEEIRVVARKNNEITRSEEKADTGIYSCESNKAFVSGIIEEEFEYSYATMWESFYKTKVKVKRKSETEDLIPILVSERLVRNIITKSFKDKWVEVAGQLRTHNKLGEDGRRHLEISLFVSAINIYDNEDDLEEITNANLVYIDGYICKPPVFRTTPLGRQITDLLIAVNRNYGKSDYIPCIVWGRNAQWASRFEVSNHVRMYGRIQSREYFKRFSEDSDAGERRTVYEVSIIRMQKIEELMIEG